ncbi:hypothetical protein NKH77_23855 [Streptomyces sp. M19]
MDWSVDAYWSPEAARESGVLSPPGWRLPGRRRRRRPERPGHSSPALGGVRTG